MEITLSKALYSLKPNSSYIIHNEDYSTLEWLDDSAKPTLKQLQAEQKRLQKEYDNNEYQRNRAFEYPPITDYLDAIVKGDQTQIEKYILDCQAVKDKYPKPE